MAFKFTILLLTCIIVNKSVSQPTDDNEVINKAFDFAYNYYNIPGKENIIKHISQFDFLLFVGYYDNLQCVKDYWTVKRGSSHIQEDICLEYFTGLVNWICSNKKYVVKNFLEQRIKEAEVLKDAYTFACKHFHIGYKKGLRHSEFVDFVGRVDNLHYVKLYWVENLESIGEQDNIWLNRFTNIVNWICLNKNIEIIEFLEKRIAAAKIITEAFETANDHYRGNKDEGLCLSEFLDFVDKDANLEHVYGYWTVKSLSPRQQDQMRLKDFLGLVYWICSKQEYDPSMFLRERLEKIGKKSKPAV